MPNKTIMLGVHYDIAMTPEELWPDGPPDDFTAEDVRKVIEEEGVREVLSWFSIVSEDIDVYVDDRDV